MEKLNKYTFSKSEKILAIEALKFDCIRQIDKCHFGVNFCKPRLKMLAELTKDDSLSFFWSAYQFGCLYRSLYRYYIYGLWPDDVRFWLCRKMLSFYRNNFFELFPFLVGRYEVRDKQ